MHADDDYTSGPRVVGDRLAPMETLDAYQCRQWANLRAVALDTYRVRQTFPYATAPSVVVETVSVEHLARITLRERRLCGCVWREDNGSN